MKINRKVMVAVLAMAMAVLVGFSGCSNAVQGNSGEQQTSSTENVSKEPSRDAVKAQDIEIDIASGVVDGERRVLFSYLNGSQYPITDLEVTYSLKSDVTDEEYESAISSINNEWSESLLDRSSKWNKVDLSAECYSLVEPGSESPQERVTLNKIYLDDMAQFDLFEPSTMRINFLSEKKIYEEIYDFKNDSYTQSKETIDTEQWVDTDLSALIPRPEGQMIIEVNTGTNFYSFKTYGTTEEAYENYIAACKEAGFVDAIVDDIDIRYYANTSDGLYSIDITPSFPYDGNMNARIERKE